MLAFSPLFDHAIDRATGVAMIACGVVGLVAGRARMVGALLMLAGVSWLMPAISVGPVSTLFVHRALLAGALLVAAEPRSRSRGSALLFGWFLVVSLVPEWAVRPVLTLVVWGALLVHVTTIGRGTPRRVPLLSAVAAQAAMCGITVLSPALDVVGVEESRSAYGVAAIVTAILVTWVAVAPPASHAVIDHDGAEWLVALREPGHEQLVTADGPIVGQNRYSRITEFDLGELGTGVLLHDDETFDEPAMRRYFEGAVLLSCERITALRRIERQRADVAASRQRLEVAERLASEGLVRELTLTVRPHLDAIDATLRAGTAEGARAAQLVAEIRNEIEELASGAPIGALSHGLTGALRALALRAGIPASFDLAEVELDPVSTMALYMVATEAVANAAKHSQAQHLRIELRAGHRVTMSVRDDGCGGASASTGGGLDHAARRLSTLGGTLTIDSAEGRGTTITAQVPPHSVTGS